MHSSVPVEGVGPSPAAMDLERGPDRPGVLPNIPGKAVVPL